MGKGVLVRIEGGRGKHNEGTVGTGEKGKLGPENTITTEGKNIKRKQKGK